MLDPHPSAALEYWFFKVNAGSLALLVDWIALRREGTHLLRVSVHAPGRRAVFFREVPPFPNGDSFLTMEQTRGHAENISWQLDIQSDRKSIQPQLFPANVLRVFDMSLETLPLARFTGLVQYSDVRIELNGEPGMIAHYWGRRLPSEWWWISAQSENGTSAVECMALRSSVWGLPLNLPLAYLIIQTPQRRRLLIAPPASARVSGTPESFEIVFKPFGEESIRLAATGLDYGDLGDGIVNTLVGDLEVRHGGQIIFQCESRAGLERQTPPASSR